MDLGVSEHKMYTHTSTYILSIHDSACLLVRVCVPSLSFSESRWRWAVAVAASLSSLQAGASGGCPGRQMQRPGPGPFYGPNAGWGARPGGGARLSH